MLLIVCNTAHSAHVKVRVCFSMYCPVLCAHTVLIGTRYTITPDKEFVKAPHAFGLVAARNVVHMHTVYWRASDFRKDSCFADAGVLALVLRRCVSMSSIFALVFLDNALNRKPTNLTIELNSLQYVSERVNI